MNPAKGIACGKTSCTPFTQDVAHGQEMLERSCKTSRTGVGGRGGSAQCKGGFGGRKNTDACTRRDPADQSREGGQITLRCVRKWREIMLRAEILGEIGMSESSKRCYGSQCDITPPSTITNRGTGKRVQNYFSVKHEAIGMNLTLPGPTRRPVDGRHSTDRHHWDPARHRPVTRPGRCSDGTGRRRVTAVPSTRPDGNGQHP
ncbi:hypothetical protein GGX14DRAFT_600265 [Mycena pura]|uniref:Uncharacterized protein n=1 Tax=Mycena pura TaxID=153505 RepID=A0AAD6UPB4_9AGAR|nr:hypothetical protein GGX14DRAFT_600265 [Mycena pura]